jgi:cation-transporting ATPase 13A1
MTMKTALRRPMFRLYAELPPWRRLDVWPFAVVYAALNFTAWRCELCSNTGVVRVCLIAAPIVLLLHFLSFLSLQWSVRSQCLLGYSPVARTDLATHVLSIPTSVGGGADALEPLLRTREGGVWFAFQQKVYQSQSGGSNFEPLDYPDAWALGDYLRSHGFASAAAVQAARDKFGANEFAIPNPSFGELFKEHATAPFFVFQVLCVLLWSLDDLWYYSMYVLALC